MKSVTFRNVKSGNIVTATNASTIALMRASDNYTETVQTKPELLKQDDAGVTDNSEHGTAEDAAETAQPQAQTKKRGKA